MRIHGYFVAVVYRRFVMAIVSVLKLECCCWHLSSSKQLPTGEFWGWWMWCDCKISGNAMEKEIYVEVILLVFCFVLFKHWYSCVWEKRFWWYLWLCLSMEGIGFSDCFFITKCSQGYHFIMPWACFNSANLYLKYIIITRNVTVHAPYT